MKTKAILTGVCAMAAAFAPRSTFASNLLVNPGFEEPNGGAGTPFSFTGIGYGGDSAAYFWGIYNFNSGTTTTEETGPPSGLSDAGMYSLAIDASSVDCGVTQAYGQPGGYTASVSGYVYLVSGSVGIGVQGSGDQLTIYASTSTTGEWIFLGANTGVLPDQIFAIVSLAPNSEFYVDNVDADTNPLTPEPASLIGLGLGSCALLMRRRRRPLK